MFSLLGNSNRSKETAETSEYPEVRHRRSGVRYVKANDLLRSEAAQRELNQADEALDALAETEEQEE
ncbi:hypothetical protein [Salinibacter ruber]|uniref:hypothetical protein n=1 Tax=Salinibacter ruber TaxID=146919 RepID=UPI0020732B28|nr:hypothetical protein [Salinibacter ruber]